MFKLKLEKLSAIAISLFVLLCTPVAKADFTYAVVEDVSCVLSCNGAATIGLAGTITVDTLGNLTPAHFTNWNLGIVLEGSIPINDTPVNSTLTFEGNPGVVAEDNRLVFQLFAPGDAVVFTGGPAALAGWRFGANPPAQYLFYQDSEAASNLPLPATFEAGRIGATEATPEPNTFALMAGGMLVAYFGLTRNKKCPPSSLLFPKKWSPSAHRVRRST